MPFLIRLQLILYKLFDSKRHYLFHYQYNRLNLLKQSISGQISRFAEFQVLMLNDQFFRLFYFLTYYLNEINTIRQIGDIHPDFMISPF